MSEFKAFQMNDFDTVAARSAEEAIEWYKRETACSDDDIYDVCEVPGAGMTWDYVDPFVTPAKEYIELKSKVIELKKGSCDTDVILGGRRYTVIYGDLFVESTYAELLQRLDPKEPMIIATSEW